LEEYEKQKQSMPEQEFYPTADNLAYGKAPPVPDEKLDKLVEDLNGRFVFDVLCFLLFFVMLFCLFDDTARYLLVLVFVVFPFTTKYCSQKTDLRKGENLVEEGNILRMPLLIILMIGTPNLTPKLQELMINIHLKSKQILKEELQFNFVCICLKIKFIFVNVNAKVARAYDNIHQKSNKS
jgi:hypothetical protein